MKKGAYSRCLLSYYVAEKIDAKKLIFKEKEFYSKNNIKLLDETKVIKINSKEKIIELSGKEKLSYDKLLIACGASSKKVKIKGMKNEEMIFTVRTKADSDEIIKALPGVENIAVLGSGLIGIKLSDALYKRGKKVNLIAKSNRLLFQMVDFNSGEFIRKAVEKKIKFYSGQDAEELIYENNKLTGLILTNNERIKCEMIIIAKGVEPNRALTDDHIKVDSGILTDEYLLTSDPDIYASGDVAETIDILTGKRGIKALWTTAVEQGKIAGRNMTGEKVVYNGALSMNSVDCFGMPVISSGYLDSQEVYEFKSEDGNSFRRIFVRDNMVTGYVTIGDIKLSGILNRLLIDKNDISKIKYLFDTSKLTREDLLECMDKNEIVNLMNKKK